VAVTEVAEVIVTVSALTPAKEAYAVYPEVKKLVPVKTIEFPDMTWEDTAGIEVDV
jgi:hypothetical protein